MRINSVTISILSENLSAGFVGAKKKVGKGKIKGAWLKNDFFFWVPKNFIPGLSSLSVGVGLWKFPLVRLFFYASLNKKGGGWVKLFLLWFERSHAPSFFFQGRGFVLLGGGGGTPLGIFLW